MSIWPPPPDLASLKELFATADIEGLIADHAPIDEYDPEAKHLFEMIQNYSTAQLTAEKILPLIEELWIQQFNLTGDQLAERRPAILALAQQIARFFGPEAQPQVRNQPAESSS